MSKKDGIRTFSQIIPRNATLPRRETKTYTPNGPNRIGMQVWEGDPDQPLDSPENFQAREDRRGSTAGPNKGTEHIRAHLHVRHERAVARKGGDRPSDGKVLLDREVQEFGERGQAPG